MSRKLISNPAVLRDIRDVSENSGVSDISRLFILIPSFHVQDNCPMFTGRARASEICVSKRLLHLSDDTMSGRKNSTTDTSNTSSATRTEIIKTIFFKNFSIAAMFNELSICICHPSEICINKNEELVYFFYGFVNIKSNCFKFVKTASGVNVLHFGLFFLSRSDLASPANSPVWNPTK